VALTPDGKPQAVQIVELSPRGALLMLAMEQQVVRGSILEVVSGSVGKHDPTLDASLK
jgi:hypothetical protein